MAERWSRHVQAFGPEHQAIHAGMGLRISDIGFGAGHRLLQRHLAGGSRRLHDGVELPDSDRTKLAHQAEDIAAIMVRLPRPHPPYSPTPRPSNPPPPPPHL